MKQWLEDNGMWLFFTALFFIAGTGGILIWIFDSGNLCR